MAKHKTRPWAASTRTALIGLVLLLPVVSLAPEASASPACGPYAIDADIQMVVDLSGSMQTDLVPGTTRLDATQNEGGWYLNQLTTSDRSGLTTTEWDGSVFGTLEQSLTPSHPTTAAVLAGLASSGTSHFAEAIPVAQDDLQNSGSTARTNIMILIGDGGQPGSAIAAADAAKAAGTIILIIHLGDSVPPTTFADLASFDSPPYAQGVTSMAQFRAALQAILDLQASGWIPPFPPTTPTNLEVTPDDPQVFGTYTHAHLEWDPSTSSGCPVHSYSIYRSENSGPWEFRDWVPASQTWFDESLTDLAPCTHLSYYVVANNVYSSSAPSAPDSMYYDPTGVGARACSAVHIP